MPHQHMPPYDDEHDAWNPGLTSALPRALLPSVTLYRPGNASTRYKDAKEAADFCGMKPQELSALTARRLAMHEVLIRVTADLYVSDGPAYEALGLNLRGMAGQILHTHIMPEMGAIEPEFAALRTRVEAALAARLDCDVFTHTQLSHQPTGWWARRWGVKKKIPAQTEPPEFAALARWQAMRAQTTCPFERACLKALHTIVSGILGQHGALMADKALVIRLAANLVCNSYGSREIGALITPIFLRAVQTEGYRLLPFQKEPFVMNVKGASGAGKSTIRPLQRELAERMGIRWEDFALVSPDYWRKFLLDYGSMGKDYKYAAMLTGQELEIIDKKLDLYMEEKARRAEMPHLLIDRFRFDSFTPSTTHPQEGRLLSRFGHTVFMFFIITPPTETVERAWKRGLATGRYKAVDDLLYHNIEAYTGMPQLFLSWVNRKPQKVHFEFLDNNVPYGSRPRTVAFGWNGEITVLDPACMRRLTGYRHINVNATRADDVYQKPTAPQEDILIKFSENIQNMRFVDPDTRQLSAAIKDGVCVYERDGFLAQNGLRALTAVAANNDSSAANLSADLVAEQKYTVGAWSSAKSLNPAP